MSQRSRRRIRGSLLVAMSLALVVVLALPALAGSFGWTVRFNESVKSRSWTAGSGDTKITSSMNCHSDAWVRTYQVRLARERTFLPDVISDWVTLPCGSTQTVTFPAWPRGDYHFELRKNGASNVYWDGTGTTRYPN